MKNRINVLGRVAGLLWVALALASCGRSGDVGTPAIQPQPTGRSGMMRTLDRLELSDAQKEQLKPIMEEQRRQLRAVRNDSTMSVQTKQKRMEAIRQQTAAKVRPILTPAQQTKYDEMRAQRQNRMNAARSSK